jgi:hypothetical protein
MQHGRSGAFGDREQGLKKELRLSWENERDDFKIL